MRFKSWNTTVFSYFFTWTFFILTAIVILNFRADTLQLTYDSHSYIKASESTKTYFFGKNEIGIPYLHRPPLLPAYLHLFDNKIRASWWLNVLSFATSLLLCIKIGRALNLKGWLLYGSLALIAINYPWLQNHFFLWTEPLFSVLVLLLTYCLIKNKSFTAVVIICMIAFFLRKAGLFLFMAAAILYFTQKEHKKWAIVSCTMLFVFVGWEILTIQLSQVSTSYTIYSDMRELSRAHFADALSSWVLPRVIPLYARLVCIAIAVSVTLFIFRDTVHGFFIKRENHILIILVFVYVTCFIVPIGVPDYHEAERYLSVVLPLVLLIFMSLYNDMIFTAPKRKKVILFILLGIWSLYPFGRTVYHFLVPHFLNK